MRGKTFKEEIRDLIDQCETDIETTTKLFEQNIKILCPFHEEKTPSLVINISHDRAHCFGCGYEASLRQFCLDYKKKTRDRKQRGVSARDIDAPVYDDFISRLKALEPLQSDLFRSFDLMAMLDCGPRSLIGRLTRLIDDICAISERRYSIEGDENKGTVRVCRER